MTQARRPIILSELPPAEARAIFDRFMSGQPENADMRGAESPWWYDHHPGFGQELGPYVARPAPSPSELENIVAELWKRRTGRSHAGSA